MAKTLSVYNPTGAGGVHVDSVISGGGRGGTVSGAKKAAPAKRAAKKAAPAKKAPFGGKQAPPFGGKRPSTPPAMMGDVPGLLDATDRRMQGKAVAKSAVLRTRQTQMQKKTPTVGEQKGGSPAIPKSVSKAGEVGVSTPRQVKQADTMVKRNSRKMPGAAKGMC